MENVIISNKFRITNVAYTGKFHPNNLK